MAKRTQPTSEHPSRAQLEAELREFAAPADLAVVPAALSERVLSQVHAALHPSPVQVLVRLAGLHLLAGLVTLSLCPQFGFRLLGRGMGLMEAFMLLGPTGCMALCGTFFVGATLLLAALALRPEEVRVLRRNCWAAAGALVLLSLAFFVMVDARLVLETSLLAWLAGAFGGGVASLELAWRARRRALSLSPASP